MIAASKPTVCVDSSATSTRSCLGEAKNPRPRIVVTWRCRANPARPPVSRRTTASFQDRSRSMSMSGAAKCSPCSIISCVSASTLAACSSALEGMHPTLRHTPPRDSPASTRTTRCPRSAARRPRCSRRVRHRGRGRRREGRCRQASSPGDRTFIHVDIEPTRIGRVFAPDYGHRQACRRLERRLPLVRLRPAASALGGGRLAARTSEPHRADTGLPAQGLGVVRADLSALGDGHHPRTGVGVRRGGRGEPHRDLWTPHAAQRG